MKNQNGNSLIKGLVTIGDFIILNIIVFAITASLPYMSDKFGRDIKMYIFICNVSMIITKMLFSPIIHLRHIDFGKIIANVFKMTVMQSILFYVCIRLIYDGGGLFNAIAYYFPAMFIAIILSRFIEFKALNWYRRRGGNMRTIVFVGNDPANMIVYKELMEDPSSGYNATGYYSNGVFEDCPPELKKLGSLDDLSGIIHGEGKTTLQADYLFCSLSHRDTAMIRDLMNYCDNNLTRFFYVPRILGTMSLGLSNERIGKLNLFTNHTAPLDDPTCRFVKRLFDITVSAVACAVTLPFIPIIALIIKIQSPGPLFFTQERTGFNGKPFKIFKFRSMNTNTDADTVQATENDPRKFPFGNLMRKWNIDEFPQFFNVLRGDMSIVGPRPHMTYHTHIYSKIIANYMTRHFYKPGITGWAQVTGYRGETRELWQMEERIHRDIWYMENWSFWLDMRIILMTVTSFFKKDDKAY